MKKHTWVVDPPHEVWEVWEDEAPVGLLTVNLRCSTCNSVAQFTASGLRPCTQERLYHQWTALPASDEEKEA